MKYRIIEETFKNSYGDISKVYKVQKFERCLKYSLDCSNKYINDWITCFDNQKFPTLELARYHVKHLIQLEKSKMHLSKLKLQRQQLIDYES